MKSMEFMDDFGERTLGSFVNAETPAWLLELRNAELVGASAGSTVDEIIERIGSRIIGQEDALRTLLEAIGQFERRLAAISRGADEDEVVPNRPVLLMGPTASGKTHLVRQVAKALDIKLFRE